MSVNVFDHRRRTPIERVSWRAGLDLLRRILLRLLLVFAMVAAVGAWTRFELPSAIEGYTLFD